MYELDRLAWAKATIKLRNGKGMIARALSDTFARIAPSGVPEFVLAQPLGAVTAIPLARVLFADARAEDSSELLLGAHRSWVSAIPDNAPRSTTRRGGMRIRVNANPISATVKSALVWMELVPTGL